MLPFQHTGELSMEATEFAGDQDQNKVEDQICLDNGATSTGVGCMFPHSVVHNNRGRRRAKRSSLLPPKPNINNDDNEQNRKVIRRNVERQRRKEMSSLCTSLRSILPHEYTKGKRSTSDHLEEAVNYIKDLEKNVQQLSDRRDQLKASKGLTSSRHEAGGSSNCTPWPGSVVILPRQGGLDIELITSAVYNDGFSLSNALQVVFEEGLNVASCTSTCATGRLIHHIVCEVNDMICVDVNRLQQKLTDLVY